MNAEKFTTGAFVFTRTRGLEPRDPDDLVPLALQHGLEPSFIPTYPGDRVAITRAIGQASRGLSREGFLLRPIRRTSSEVVYGIVREQRDESHQRLDHDFEDVIAWAAEPDPSVVGGDHDIANRVRGAYQQLRGKIVADDWSSSITAYLESHDAARMRGDGRVFWVPPQRIGDIKKLGAFLAEIDIDLVLCEIEPETRTVVQDVAQVSIDEELDRLQEEADTFDGKQKPSTYARRLEEYQRLRQRAVLYRDALGVGASRAQQVLDELEARVSDMLTLRKQTVIHRDGSASDVSSSTSASADAPETTEIPPPSPPSRHLLDVGEPSRAHTSLRFAGAQFTLAERHEPGVITFVSDDDAAKNAVAPLESMGIAGKWQQAGMVKIRLQNSGPPGAAVSLCVELPKGRTLADSAASLAMWGIELAA
jgi:hypothetical protein